MTTELEQVIAFARSQGYYTAEYDRKWNGYYVYQPLFRAQLEGKNLKLGPPFVILMKGDELRMSTVKEAFEFLDYVIREDRLEDECLREDEDEEDTIEEV